MVRETFPRSHALGPPKLVPLNRTPGVPVFLEVEGVTEFMCGAVRFMLVHYLSFPSSFPFFLYVMAEQHETMKIIGPVVEDRVAPEPETDSKKGMGKRRKQTPYHRNQRVSLFRFVPDPRPLELQCLYRFPQELCMILSCWTYIAHSCIRKEANGQWGEGFQDQSCFREFQCLLLPLYCSDLDSKR